MDEKSFNSVLDNHSYDEEYKYSEEELLSFLNEIDDDDANLAKAELDAFESIEDDKPEEEINQIADELEHDSDGWYTKNGVKLQAHQKQLIKGQNQLKDSLKQWRDRREIRKREIYRWAFDQTVLPLNEHMTVERKKMIIEILTKPIRNLIKQYEEYINSRVTKLLLPAIPASLKVARTKWPWSFVANPGFLYKVPSKDDSQKTFWVIPDVPYYFRQGTEQEILEERNKLSGYDFLKGLNRAIERWYSARTNLARREVKYASKLINIKGNSYYHLLLLDPLWFEKLYIEVEKEKQMKAL